MVKLGVNVDHIATLRQARGGADPDPVLAALLCEKAGADSIVAHLREDRRHMQDRDIVLLRKAVKTRFNLEMSLNAGIVRMALAIRPDQATLVPERRREITTEGGLDVVAHFEKIKKVNHLLKTAGIDVSLFIDPDKKQIDAVLSLGIKIIELHTGAYAQSFADRAGGKAFSQIKMMTRYARQSGMIVNAGHGLNYENTHPISAIEGITELNIGHAIISRSVFVGLKDAVRTMKALL